MGFFVGLDKDAYDRQYNDGYLLKRLWSYFSHQKGRVFMISLLGVVVSILLALLPILISIGVDALENNRGTEIIWYIVVALMFITLGQYIGNWYRRILTNHIIGDMTANMRKDAVRAAVERDMAFYDENKTGKVLSRITSDTEDFGQILIVTSDIVSQMIQVVILLVVLLSQNVWLTFLLLLFMIPIIGATLWLRKMARTVTRQGSRAMAAVNDNIQETVTGISVAKNFRQEQLVYDEFVRVNTQSYNTNLKRGMVLAFVFPLLNGLAGLAVAAVVYLGAISAREGIIAIGVWYLYFQSVDRFLFPVINVSTYWSQFQQAISSLERVMALIDAENTVKQTDSRPVENLQGAIEFKNIHFEYKSDQPVLDNFSLKIAPGESVAFVGHTGAGKSSIVKLIMRLYEFQSGQICIDGHDIRTFDLHSYRSQLGFVPQAPFLFSGTIADNIRYGKPDATDEEIKHVAYSIGNGEWLETLPNGLESHVGERGARLSIGQRQLVSLLRVLVQKPAIFILDEATASVDNFTEAQIQEALDLILSQSTSILIAHRLSTVRSADRIIVLRQGKIIEEGNHEALMGSGGHYAELYNTYFRHQSLTYVENARTLLAD